MWAMILSHLCLISMISPLIRPSILPWMHHELLWIGVWCVECTRILNPLYVIGVLDDWLYSEMYRDSPIDPYDCLAVVHTPQWSENNSRYLDRMSTCLFVDSNSVSRSQLLHVLVWMRAIKSSIFSSGGQKRILCERCWTRWTSSWKRWSSRASSENSRSDGWRISMTTLVMEATAVTRTAAMELAVSPH